jgi:tubulin monoglycylase TTLL3/8
MYNTLGLRDNPCRNIWIVKPGQNSKGSGVKCCDSLDKITGSVRKMNARIVQKYLETPLLLSVPALGTEPVKFDIR